MLEQLKFLDRCSLASTDQEKLDVIVEYLTRRHLEYEGGYPHEHKWSVSGDRLTITERTSGDEEGPVVCVQRYTKRQLLTWFDAAKKMHRGEDGVMFDDCLMETHP